MAILGNEYPENTNYALQVRLGQYPLQKYNEQLLHLIEVGRIEPTKIISHTMKLDEARKVYGIFDMSF
ncbi:hypothetical protein BH18THE2_BH18THE2_38200 [soil metagenome]